jgi:putative hemolysin
LLIAMSAFFSGSETAFSSVNRIRLKNYASAGDKRAKRAIYIVDNYDNALSAILIGNNIVNIASASIGTIICTDLFGPAWGPVASTAIMTLLVLCFGEILPKCIAKENAERMALSVGGILSALMVVLKPLIWIFVKLKSLVLRRFTSSDKMPSVTEEELKTIIEEIEDEGVLQQHESELIQSALEFDDITVSEILTHRVDVIGVEADADIESIKQIFLTERFSRLPVYEKSLDNVLGIISDKDFFREYLKNPNFMLSSIIQETLFVPPKKSISQLLRQLQRTKCQLAIVTDQYGGTLGLITLEDILEELVGEIWDEDEEIVNEIIPLSECSYQVSGDCHLDDLFEQIDPEHREYNGENNTVSGWVLDMMQKIPEEGETCTVDCFQITVQEVEEQRIKQVVITVLPPASSEEE